MCLARAWCCGTNKSNITREQDKVGWSSRIYDYKELEAFWSGATGMRGTWRGVIRMRCKIAEISRDMFKERDTRRC